MEHNIPDQFNGFSRIEYLSVFVALLYGFVVAEYFLGWGKMFRKREVITFSWEHIAWTALFFLVIVMNYYSMWFRVAYLEMGFFYYLLVFVPILIFYFASIYLFPEFDGEGELNLKLYFLKSNKGVIALMGVYFLLNFIISNIFHEDDLVSIANIARLLFIILGAITILYNRLWMRVVLLSYMTLALVVSLMKISGAQLLLH